jgi:hypothetical protein
MKGDHDAMSARPERQRVGSTSRYAKGGIKLDGGAAVRDAA